MPRTAKPLESLTKSALLDVIGRKLGKDEVLSLAKAVSHGYRPYVHTEHEALNPQWLKPQVSTNGYDSEHDETPLTGSPTRTIFEWTFFEWTLFAAVLLTLIRFIL